MTDEEMTRLCAEAMGYKIDDSECNGGGAGNTGFDILGRAVLDWHNGVFYSPLTDRAQAFDLIDKLRLYVRPLVNRRWEVCDFANIPVVRVVDSDLRRVAVECAAKVQKGRMG